MGFDDGRTAHFTQEASNSLKPLEISENFYKLHLFSFESDKPYLRHSIVLLRIQILLILLKFKCYVYCAENH